MGYIFPPHKMLEPSWLWRKGQQQSPVDPHMALIYFSSLKKLFALTSSQTISLAENCSQLYDGHNDRSFLLYCHFRKKKMHADEYLAVKSLLKITPCGNCVSIVVISRPGQWQVIQAFSPNSEMPLEPMQQVKFSSWCWHIRKALDLCGSVSKARECVVIGTPGLLIVTDAQVDSMIGKHAFQRLKSAPFAFWKEEALCSLLLAIKFSFFAPLSFSLFRGAAATARCHSLLIFLLHVNRAELDQILRESETRGTKDSEVYTSTYI